MHTATTPPPNTIPPMTHPLSRGWDQPSTAGILTDDQDAIVEAATFDRLCDYSTSVPSGVYEGKVWRRQKRFGKPEEGWLLCWYDTGRTPDECRIESRNIILVA